MPRAAGSRSRAANQCCTLRFLLPFLTRLRAEGVHVLLETAGNYQWERLAPLLPVLDAIYFDWKVPANDYRAHTGHDATRVAGQSCADSRASASLSRCGCR